MGGGLTAPPIYGKKDNEEQNPKPNKKSATKKEKGERFSISEKVMLVGLEEETNTAGRKAGARAVWNDEEQAAAILAG